MCTWFSYFMSILFCGHTVWGQMAISAYLWLFMQYYFKAGLVTIYFQLRFNVFDRLGGGKFVFVGRGTERLRTHTCEACSHLAGYWRTMTVGTLQRAPLVSNAINRTPLPNRDWCLLAAVSHSLKNLIVDCVNSAQPHVNYYIVLWGENGKNCNSPCFLIRILD